MRLGQASRPLLPAALRGQGAGRRNRRGKPARRPRHARQVLMLAGCVQPSMMPTIDAATIRVLDAAGIGTHASRPEAGCCGADQSAPGRCSGALWGRCAPTSMRVRPLVESGRVEAIVMNASGCGAMVKEYAHHLRKDAGLCADRAARIVALVRDVAEIVAPHAGLSCASA